LAMPYSTIEVE